ncbi:Prophage PssSM-01, putative tail protein [Pseudomonas syringae]|uniref:phage tail protein n=1 Tax=Pseudomonas syringae TaxID=317 RepID=UPI000EFA9229|nr:phage tail protein [Pseudomonas syringae]RMN67590.1 Prophage PssSM-01, putative tail protein [Pseudomonas syringae]
MIKLKALTAYLLERQLVAPEQLDSWTDQVQVELVWKPDTQGMHMGDMNYGATISIERFADHPARLFALVGSWLETRDQDREGLPNVVFDVVMLDNDLADVDIKLQFTEAQYLAEDPAGEIEAFGGTWSFVPFELWVAESGEVTGHGL